MVATDQRGVSRQLGGSCDAGAVEAAPELTTVTPEPAGAACAAGGVRIASGEDRDGDGAIEGEEAAAVSFVCDGVDTLVASSPEPPGAACASGGVRLDSGQDLDADGVLDASEITSTTYVCRTPGSLVTPTVEPPGTNCPHGGVKLETRVDANGDGVFAADETTATAYVCDPPVPNTATVGNRPALSLSLSSTDTAPIL